MMHNLRDTTFMIPLKIESEDRKRIIVLLLSYIFKHFDTNVIICEEGSAAIFPKLMKQEWSKKLTYIFRKNDTNLFHKTKNLNIMTKRANTPIIVSQDSDVVFHPHQYINAAHLIRSNLVDFCYPFNQATHNITPKFQNQFGLTLSLVGIEPHIKFEHPLPPPGGCFFMNKQKFIQGGLENETFVSWGPEDTERRDRLIKLGFRIASTDGKLFHLDHSRTPNSTTENPKYRDNETEYAKIKSLSREQLIQYIGTWPWTK
jgi:hypothetical protein